MFDLPMDTPKARNAYTRFRKLLLRQGFVMLQLSVYARHCASEEASIAQRKRVIESLPPDGQVRLLSVTDRQFGKMEVFFGEKREPVEDPPAQLSFF